VLRYPLIASRLEHQPLIHLQHLQGVLFLELLAQGALFLLLPLLDLVSTLVLATPILPYKTDRELRSFLEQG
jgi:hypothetical protein